MNNRDTWTEAPSTPFAYFCKCKLNHGNDNNPRPSYANCKKTCWYMIHEAPSHSSSFYFYPSYLNTDRPLVSISLLTWKSRAAAAAATTTTERHVGGKHFTTKQPCHPNITNCVCWYLTNSLSRTTTHSHTSTLKHPFAFNHSWTIFSRVALVPLVPSQATEQGWK